MSTDRRLNAVPDAVSPVNEERRKDTAPYAGQERRGRSAEALPMYAAFFGLTHAPFSIAPDPRYLFMSERHREALAHLLYGVNGGGGFVLLTGEIGAGKTTVCRAFLEQVPRRCNVAYVFNPKLTVEELLRTVCDEFRVPYADAATVKDFVDPLNDFLLRTHGVGQNDVLVIDEAQNLSAGVLEQLRLLTNLETNERKLLQIVLIGQPELRTMLARPELEQLAQRVIARYHLDALSEAETTQYVAHRLAVAGRTGALPFDRRALARIHAASGGVPRRINLLCDRALLGAYAGGRAVVDAGIVDRAAKEVFESAGGALMSPFAAWPRSAWLGAGVLGGLAAAAVVAAAALALHGRAPHGAGSAALPPPASPVASASVPRPEVGFADAAGKRSDAGAGGGGAGSGRLTGASSNGRPTDAAGTADAALAFPPAAGVPLALVTTADPSAATSEKPETEGRLLIESEADAWRELAALWGVALQPQEDPCRAVERSGLRCFRDAGGLATIRSLDRPGLLAVRDDAGRAGSVLLVGLGASSATLRQGNALRTVALASLARVWRGDFATLWRRPDDYNGPLAEGAAGPAVDRLAAALAKTRGEPPPAVGRPYDAVLAAQVRAFQLAQGLRTDGVAGPTTWMQLQRAGGVEEPRLAAQK